jgi:hypothetical protein
MNNFYENDYNDEINQSDNNDDNNDSDERTSNNNYNDNSCNNETSETKLEPFEVEFEKIPNNDYSSTSSKVVSTKMNTKLISHRIQSFLKKHQIHKKYFCHKILGTSILLYENLIEKPKEWSNLNSMFKLYFKKMSTFIRLDILII